MIQKRYMYVPNDEDGPIAVCTGTQQFPIPSVVWEQNEKKSFKVCVHILINLINVDT